MGPSPERALSLSEAAPGLLAIAAEVEDRPATGRLTLGALLCDAAGRLLSAEHAVDRGNPVSPCGSVRHTGHAFTGGDTGTGRIEANLVAVPTGTDRIVLTVSADEPAPARRPGLVIVNRAGGRALIRAALPDVVPAGTGTWCGELYRDGGTWWFRRPPEAPDR